MTSPFSDFGPDPVCVPDPESDDPDDYEEAVVYNVVANPTLVFSGNFFHVFGDELLAFPGADRVPLGKMEVKGNKVGRLF